MTTYTRQTAGKQPMKLNVRHWLPGTYSLILQWESTLYLHKLVKKEV